MKIRKLFAIMFILMLSVEALHAASATWSLNPGSGDWNTATNWTPATVPNGSSDTAMFAASNTTGISLSANTEVNAIVFNSGASAFTITANPTFLLTVSGAGIANNSVTAQNFVSAGLGEGGGLYFTNDATVGSLTHFTNEPGHNSGQTYFFGHSSAGNGTFINNGSSSGDDVGGGTSFDDNSTAGSGTFTNNGAAVSFFHLNGGYLSFAGHSSALNGSFTNNGGTVNGAGGGSTSFSGDNSTAGKGTFINNPGAVSGAGSGITYFFDRSTAGSGTFTNNGNAAPTPSNKTKAQSAAFLERRPLIVDGDSEGIETKTQFNDNSSADHGTFTNNPGVISSARGGYTQFTGNSNAGNGTFINNGGTISGGAIDNGGITFFNGGSTANAGSGTFINNGGSVAGAAGSFTYFGGNSTASNGTLTNNGGAVGGAGGGTTFFDGDSAGGTAKVEVFGNGNLDISLHNAPGVTIGSTEGNGAVFLGARNLTVGSNNPNTLLSGLIQDGGYNGGTGGSLAKIGTGTLTLSGANTYTGGTLINAGTLQVLQDGALGAGDVSVTASGATLRMQTGAANNYIADAATLSIVSGSTVDLNFSEPPDTVRSLVVDGVVQPAGLYGSAASGAPHQLPEFTGIGKILVTTAPTPTPTPTPAASTVLANISTRLRVETGDNVLIGGFIVTGTQPKRIIVRAIGPSLPLAGALADPILELHGPGGFATITNDNWRTDQEPEIIATTIPPSNDLESAIVATLPANSSAYTAIVRGVNNGTGIGVVEAYDLDRTVDSKLANISTRGLVQTGNNVMIAGTIVLGPGTQRVLVRAIGPSLPVSGKLENPTLELRDGNGALIRANNDWRSDQEAEIIATTIPPTNDLESALIETLNGSGAAYTAIVSGVGGTTGVAVVEIYALN